MHLQARYQNSEESDRTINRKYHWRVPSVEGSLSTDEVAADGARNDSFEASFAAPLAAEWPSSCESQDGEMGADTMDGSTDRDAADCVLLLDVAD